MKKAVLVTRGRTGSTAVIDEFGKILHLIASQELFLIDPITDKELLKDYYKLLPPFDHWKRQALRWKQFFPSYYSEPRQADRYLKRAETLAQRRRVQGFIWKLLSHQLDERPYLGELLRQRGYQAIYLRRNPASQVLSGMVANQRGIYNSLEKINDARKYRIDIDQFTWLVQWERECAKNDCARLEKEGIDYMVVSYEDYCDDRQGFYSRIFDFLHLTLEQPPASDFVKMIEDPSAVVENYEELVHAALAMGETL